MNTLKEFARNYVPAPANRQLRRWGASVRYRSQLAAAQECYRKYEASYDVPILFIAGLPKSGTTWMENMLSSYPGYEPMMIPEAIRYELDHGGSHDFDLPSSLFERLDEVLAVLKLHVHGSEHNVEQLGDADLPYLIMYRDLRDVAISHYFYVRRTPWHPEYGTYANLDVEAGLVHFGRTLLPAFDDWVRSWERNRHQENSLIVRYEDLLSDTETIFSDVARLYGLDDSKETIQDIVEAHSFENVSGGRERGQQSESSFFRKGVSGDWKNHFTDQVREVFKENAGGFWVDHGYEEEPGW